MFKIIFLPILMILAFSCDRLKVDRRKDKVFPMSVSDFDEGVTLRALLERTELEELINLASSPVVLDLSLYEVIKKKHEKQILGDIREIVDVTLDETKLREFLKRDNVDIEINKEISIEIDGVVVLGDIAIKRNKRDRCRGASHKRDICLV